MHKEAAYQSFGHRKHWCPTWIREGPGTIHIAYVCCNADYQDAVHQGDKATVPFIAPGPIDITQDEVE